MGNIDVHDGGSYTEYIEQIEAGGGVLVCTEDNDTGALDHTWQEIHDANCAIVRFDSGDEIFISQILHVGVSGNPPTFNVEAYVPVTDDHLTYTLERQLYTAQSANGYPVFV